MPSARNTKEGCPEDILLLPHLPDLTDSVGEESALPAASAFLCRDLWLIISAIRDLFRMAVGKVGSALVVIVTVAAVADVAVEVVPDDGAWNICGQEDDSEGDWSASSMQ
jgi:hypothetical protein